MRGDASLGRREFFRKLARRAVPSRAGRAAVAKIAADACRNHQVCAAVCRTGALRAYTDDDDAATGVVFEAAACTACSECLRACPERALTLIAQGNDIDRDGPTILTRWALR